jgi:methyl-accepting chemotaxis protein
MNFFNNFKVGTKIFSGFVVILTLMGIVGGLAIFQFTQIKFTVTNLADNFAKDQHLADQMVARILLARFYANKYIRGNKAEDLARFKEEFVYFKELLAEASIEITKGERVKMLTDIKAGVQNYGENFTQVTQLIDKRHEILFKTLDVQGPVAEEKLEQLRESAFKADDAIASFYAGNAQRALLLMRLDAFKYLEEGNTRWTKKFDEHYQKAQIAFQYLDQELQNPTRRQLAQTAQTTIDKYRQGFINLQAGYNKQNQIIETQLNVIGPKIRKTASKMSESVTIDFDATNQQTHILVDQTRWQLFITMLIAMLVGISFGLFISRSITVPLATVINMSNKMAVGIIKHKVDIQSHYKINQLRIRQDEIGNIGRAYDTLATYFSAMINDIVLVSQGLKSGDLRVVPQAQYRGDFVRIKNSLESALSNLQLVVEDIVQLSQGLADGKKNVVAEAEYQGDFTKIKNALKTAATKLAEATAKNAIQDWLKTGQTQLNEQISGEQDVVTLAKNIITFLTTYLEMPVGVFYILENNDKDACLKLLASYAYTQRKGIANEFKIGEGLVGQAALEKERIIVTNLPENYITIQSGLGEAIPQQLIVIPFLYENAVKGILEIGSFQEITKIKLELLEQVMPSIGIAINTAESRTKMQALLQK